MSRKVEAETGVEPELRRAEGRARGGFRAEEDHVLGELDDEDWCRLTRVSDDVEADCLPSRGPKTLDGVLGAAGDRRLLILAKELGVGAVSSIEGSLRFSHLQLRSERSVAPGGRRNSSSVGHNWLQLPTDCDFERPNPVLLPRSGITTLSDCRAANGDKQQDKNKIVLATAEID